MFTTLRSIWRPGMYHGQRRRRHYFEGWYYKLVDAGEEHVYAVIPGIFRGDSEAGAHSFVQVLDGRSGRSVYHRYPAAAFAASPHGFDIAVGPNRFTAGAIRLDIDRPEQRVQGELRFHGLSPWPVSLASPGAMGWYAFVPFMECYHGILSLDHRIDGTLQVDGTAADFSGGRGYIEKDWGKSFPRAWVWTQSNHFDVPGTSVTASVAVIPWLGSAFRGFIIGFRHQGRLYRFATYTGAALHDLRLSDREVSLQVSQAELRLEVTASRAEGGLLHGPSRTEMRQRVMESLGSLVAVRLARHSRGETRLLFEGTGRFGGLELGGELAAILGPEKRDRP